MPRLVLASTSRYRADLLRRLGLPFEAMAPDCDEDAVKARGLPAEELVSTLARMKAESVVARLKAEGAAPGQPGALIIGSDQAAELDGEILGKPGSAEGAQAQLARLAGREHRLLTAVCVLEADTGRRAEALDVHELRLRQLSADQIARYVAADDPVDCAGAYKIEGLGVTLFESIRGEDFTAVIGLPLTRLTALLAEFGVILP
jgi:septum formation protein